MRARPGGLIPPGCFLRSRFISPPDYVPVDTETLAEPCPEIA